MSVEEDISKAEIMMEDIESYINSRVWNPDLESQASRELGINNMLLNQLITGHGEKIEPLSDKQVHKISDLLKRLEHSKDRFPLPPWAKWKK